MADIRETTAMGRFEIMCERYINGSEREREVILSFLSDEERQTFLTGCGLYHLFTDPAFYRAVQESMGEALYKEFRETKPGEERQKTLELIQQVADQTLSKYRGSITRKAYEDDIRKIRMYVDLGFYLKENYTPEEA